MSNQPDDKFDREENQRQMEGMIALLAERLSAMCPQTRATPPLPEPVKPETFRRFYFYGRKVQFALAEPAITETQPPAAELDELPARPAPSWNRLNELCEQLQLSQFDAQIILLCLASELNCRVATLIGLIQRNNHSRPTLELAIQLFHPQDNVHALSPGGQLRAWRLVEADRSPMDSPLHAGLWLDARIIDFLLGEHRLDERLARISSLFMLPNGVTPLVASHQGIFEDLAAIVAMTPQAPPSSIIQLAGPDAAAKLELAARLTPTMRLYRVSAEQLPQSPDEIETLAVLWRREDRLGRVALLIDAEELDGGSERAFSVSRLLDRLAGETTCFLSVRTRWRLNCSNVYQEVRRPSPVEQADAWRLALSAQPAARAVYEQSKRLAWKYSLPIPRINAMALGLRTQGVPEWELDAGLERWCQESVMPRIEPLARRIDVRATIDDIILPVAQKQTLRQIVRQVELRQRVYGDWGFERRMNRGLGISALFAGESGTGKTMAAEVVANMLGLPLYLIDLSMVVSKYIGETEKNLARVFDAAEDGGGILCFDECDALFGKRSEVKDSHDRYANIEINYLLQRIEAYRGLAILTTNMKSALDTAFTRRLRFSLNFSAPDESQRLQIWKRAFPEEDSAQAIGGVPLDLTEFDYERLARWNLTGATIHSIALNASFRAAANGSKVTFELIQGASRDEMSKLGRMASEVEYKPMMTARPAVASDNGSRI